MVTNLRPELARHLRQRLTAFGDGFRHNLALLGPAGSGKTFQLQQLLASAPANLLVLYCQLYRESCRSFLQRLLSAVRQTGLSGGATEGQLPQTAAAIQVVEALINRRLYGEAFTKALDTIPVLAAERARPIVFILDEFLYLEELGLSHAFHELGKRVMTWPSTLFILSSSAVHRAQGILRERLQLLFGQFELLMLEAVDHQAVSVWLQQELRGVRGALAMNPFLIEWLGGYPWYLAVLARRIKELATLTRAPRLTEPLFLQAAWDLIGRSEGPLHQWCASRIETLVRSQLGARAQEALMQIAQGARTTTELGHRIGRTRLSSALQLLVEHDLVQRNGMCWVVVDPILRCWLSTVFSTQRSGAAREEGDIREQVECHLRQLWLQWAQAHELSFADRVVALFERFREEVVSVDSKTGRLPRFDTIHTQRPGIPGIDAFLIADGKGRRWCATIHSDPVEEGAIAGFEAFCRAQTPKPSRKVVVMKAGMDENARLLAKAANMWVWGADDLRALMELYGQP